MWLLLATAARAATTAGSLEAAWSADAPSIAKHGPIPIELSAEDYAELAVGESVAHRVDTETGSFATGAVWVEAPVSAAWIAIQDSKDRPLGRDLFHEVLPGETPGHRLTYMRMELSWPVSDRQWVAELAHNRALFDATGGRVWQRRWTLADPALAPHPTEDAIWLPASEGAWTLIGVDGGTLCLFAIRTEMGGAIPESISRSFAISTVKKGLGALVTNASDMPTHYRGDHEVVVTPDNVPIPLSP